MADKLTNIPFHDNFHVTAIYGQKGDLWSLGFHTGIDLVAVNDKTIYANCNGVVYSKGYSNAYGNHIYIYDESTKYYHHFCHLENDSPLNVGQTVDRNTVVGIMGATGNVTGAHLHYELMINNISFVAENFIDPTIWLKIPNEKGLYNWQDYSIDDTPIEPPTPIIPIKKKRKKFKWVLYTRKFRNRY